MLVDNKGLSLKRIAKEMPTIAASQPHESRSQKYLFIPTLDILKALIEHDFVPVSVQVRRAKNESKQGFTKHLVRVRRKTDLGSTLPDIHEILLMNSHDGSSSYKIMGGIFRLVCTNGLVVGEYTDVYKVAHSHRTVEEVIEGTYKVVEGSAKVLGDIEEMKRIDLRPEEMRRFSQQALLARFRQPKEEDIVEGEIVGEVPATTALVPYEPESFLVPRREEDAARDLWTVYNVVQENMVRGGVTGHNRTGHKHDTRPVTGINQSVRLNLALWQLAVALLREKRGEPASPVVVEAEAAVVEASPVVVDASPVEVEAEPAVVEVEAEPAVVEAAVVA